MLHPDYIRRLQAAIEATHSCNAVHVESVVLDPFFRARYSCSGMVEVFDLLHHPTAKRCYIWSHEENGRLHSACVLELPPVDSPESAVVAAMAQKV